jgi:hypothetical protein
LEDLYRLRNQIVHGFEAAPMEPAAVTYLTDLARRLLEEAETATQPA